MKCSNCGVEMEEIVTDYRYNESGLKNVVLSGIDALRCPKCKETVPKINNVKGLHKTLAGMVCQKKSILAGEEIRFIRKEMRLKSKDFAQILGVHKVTVSRWENGNERLSPTSDRLIRMLYQGRVVAEKCLDAALAIAGTEALFRGIKNKVGASTPIRIEA